MINFNENQNTIGDEQGCGGYSLAAVLVEMRKTEMETKAETEIIEVELTNQSRGRTIYNEIQKLQNDHKTGIKNPVLQAIVKDTQSLPSIICQVARSYGLGNIEVHYSPDTLHDIFIKIATKLRLSDIVNIASGAITEEEDRIKDRLKKNVVDHANISDIGSESGAYYIVLVNNATHWVVVKNDATGCDVYDPANQLDKLSAVTKNFSGLFIKCWK